MNGPVNDTTTIPIEERLRIALQAARDAIAIVPENTWGINAMGDGSVPGGFVSWPIKEEILHNIDAALAIRAATVPSADEIAETIHNERWGGQAWAEATETCRNGERQIARAVLALFKRDPESPDKDGVP